jgi:hypothetical protein
MLTDYYYPRVAVYLPGYTEKKLSVKHNILGVHNVIAKHFAKSLPDAFCQNV